MPQRQATDALGPRTICLLFDGTSNEFDSSNTNVVKLFSLLKKDDFSQQLIYYQPGIGTYLEPGAVSPLFEYAAKIADQAIAWFINSHVMDGYKFLQKNYRKGDRILLFGFSRGAYTARALAGMLSRVGLLPKDNVEMVSFAFKVYADTSHEGVTLAKGFKRTFSQEITIDFLGVWDTVASVGVLRSRTLPFVGDSNRSIRIFRHALALDEHRAKFRPNMYHQTAPTAAAGALDPEHGSPILGTPEAAREGQDGKQSLARQFIERLRGSKARGSTDLPHPVVTVTSATGPVDAIAAPSSVSRGKNSIEKEESTIEVPVIRRTIEDYLRRSTDSNSPTRWHRTASRAKRSTDKDRDDLSVQEIPSDVLEVWFSGTHSDVGGGAVPDTTKNSLGQISLRWMTREIMAAQLGVLWDNEALAREEIPRMSFPPMSSVRAGTEELKLDMEDSTQPMHDQMKIRPAWWLMEILPLKFAWQDQDGTWHKRTSFHLGRGRLIIDPAPKFHFTVRERIETGTYTPKAQYKTGTEVYVE